MSCCGKMRMQGGASLPAPANVATGMVAFEYIGKTALTVIGPMSKTTYRFDQPGARLAIDSRDQMSLDKLPMLRRC